MNIKIFHEQNNESFALNVSFVSQNSEEITLVQKSEHNLRQENNVLLLMINDDENFCCKKQIRIILI